MIVEPRSRSAKRTCQYACFPVPNTVKVLTFVRLFMRREEASAVRNAVTSSALRKPNGLPEASIRVRAPWGVVASLSGIGASLSADKGGAASVTTELN